MPLPTKRTSGDIKALSLGEEPPRKKLKADIRWHRFRNAEHQPGVRSYHKTLPHPDPATRSDRLVRPGRGVCTLFAGDDPIKKSWRYYNEIINFIQNPRELSLRDADELNEKYIFLTSRQLLPRDRLDMKALFKVKSIIRYISSKSLQAFDTMDVIEFYLAPLNKGKEIRCCCEKLFECRTLKNDKEFIRFLFVLIRNYQTGEERAQLLDEINKKQNCGSVTFKGGSSSETSKTGVESSKKPDSSETSTSKGNIAQNCLEGWLTCQLKSSVNAFVKGSENAPQQIIKTLIAHFIIGKANEVSGINFQPEDTSVKKAIDGCFLLRALFFPWGSRSKNDEDQKESINIHSTFIKYCLENSCEFVDRKGVLRQINSLMKRASYTRCDNLMKFLWSIYYLYYDKLSLPNPFKNRFVYIRENLYKISKDELGDRISSLERDFPYITEARKQDLNFAKLNYYAESCKDCKIGSKAYSYNKEMVLSLASKVQEEKLSVKKMIRIALMYIRIREYKKAFITKEKIELHPDFQRVRNSNEELLRLQIELLSLDDKISDDKAHRDWLAYVEKYLRNRIKIFTESSNEAVSLSSEDELNRVVSIMMHIPRRKCFETYMDNAYQTLKSNPNPLIHMSYLHFAVIVSLGKAHSCSKSLIEGFDKQFSKMGKKQCRNFLTQLCHQHIISADQHYSRKEMKDLYARLLKTDVIKEEIYKTMAVRYLVSAERLLDKINGSGKKTYVSSSKCALIKEDINNAFQCARESGYSYMLNEVKGHVASLFENTTIFDDKRIAPGWQPSKSAYDYFKMAHLEKSGKEHRPGEEVDFYKEFNRNSQFSLPYNARRIFCPDDNIS